MAALVECYERVHDFHALCHPYRHLLEEMSQRDFLAILLIVNLPALFFAYAFLVFGCLLDLRIEKR
jgi:hypothetical protein